MHTGVFSASRLTLYQSFFKTKTDAELQGVYYWHQALSAALWPLLSHVEVALRNSVHHCMSSAYGGSGATSYAWYMDAPNHMQLRGVAAKIRDDLLLKKDSHGNLLVNHADDFVNHSTMGFWVEALRQVEQGKRFTRATNIFRSAPSTDKSQRALWVNANIWLQLIAPFDAAQELRNRIAHHRPIFKWRYMDTRTGNVAIPATSSGTMTSILQQVQSLEKALGWISPEAENHWKDCFARQWLYQLCSSNAYLGFKDATDFKRVATINFRDIRFARMSDLFT